MKMQSWRFAEALITAPTGGAFLADFRPFQRQIARLGMLNSLSQTLIKFTVPGVPDIYQGCECWDFSLVDPDNRRLVDFCSRQTMLTALEALVAQESDQRCSGVRALCDTLEDGRAKLLIIRTALVLRERWSEVFQKGKYLPLAVKGVHAAHLCAYARSFGERTVIIVVPRFFAQLLVDHKILPLGEKVWGVTTVELPSYRDYKQYTCTFTGKVLKPQKRRSRWHIPVSQILAEFPVGLIIGENVST